MYQPRPGSGRARCAQAHQGDGGGRDRAVPEGELVGQGTSRGPHGDRDREPEHCVCAPARRLDRESDGGRARMSDERTGGTAGEAAAARCIEGPKELPTAASKTVASGHTKAEASRARRRCTARSLPGRGFPAWSGPVRLSPRLGGACGVEGGRDGAGKSLRQRSVCWRRARRSLLLPPQVHRPRGERGVPRRRRRSRAPRHRRASPPAWHACSWVRAPLRAAQASARSADAAAPEAPAPGPSGLSPAALATAYGFSGTNRGAGETIAIVDAYDDPTIAANLSRSRASSACPPAPRQTAASPR